KIKKWLGDAHAIIYPSLLLATYTTRAWLLVSPKDYPNICLLLPRFLAWSRTSFTRYQHSGNDGGSRKSGPLHHFGTFPRLLYRTVVCIPCSDKPERTSPGYFFRQSWHGMP